MSVVSLEGFTPPPRYDNLPWTHQRMEFGASAEGAWAAVETQVLIPVDADPSSPQSRNMTSALAPANTGWFRIVFIDAALNEVQSGAVYVSTTGFAPLGRTVGELVDELLDIAGVDVDDDRALAWVNDKHATMVARSRSLKQRLEMGDTDGSQSYTAPGVVELYELEIGGNQYKKVRRQDMNAARQSRLLLGWPGLIFSAEADEGGNATYEVYPAPDAGQAIVVFAAVYPPLLGRGDRLMVPRTMEQAIIEGAFARYLAFDTEQTGQADRFEQRFDTACEELRRTVRTAARASGPTWILVKGLNA